VELVLAAPAVEVVDAKARRGADARAGAPDDLPDQHVVLRVSEQPVVAGAAVEPVLAVVSSHHVVAAPAAHLIVLDRAGEVLRVVGADDLGSQGQAGPRQDGQCRRHEHERSHHGPPLLARIRVEGY
jgi:hypothetical protein